MAIREALVGMMRRHVATVAVAIVALAAVYFAGLAVGFAALLLIAAAIAIGSALDRRAARSAWSLVVLGLAAIAALVGWLLPFPLHDARLYLAVLALLLLWRGRDVLPVLRAAGAQWRDWQGSHPYAFALLLLSIAVASLTLWLPTLGYDDNAFHLLMGEQLLAGRYYRMDASSQLWALAPWSNDVLHSVAGLLAGREARAAIAACWLLAGAAGAYRLALALDARTAPALLAAAVFASQPFSAYFGGTLQVDAAVAAVYLHLLAEFVESKGELRAPVTAGALLGLLAGLKASNVVFALPLLLWLGWRALRTREIKPLLLMVVVAAVVGGSSYAYAWLVTGNPVFPLFNAVFASPYMALENFQDARWNAGLSWRTPFELTFATGKFGEVYTGAAGVAFLATLPGVVLAILRPGAARWVALAALASGIALFSQVQYVRYVFPAMAVLSTVGLLAYARWLGDRSLAVLATVLVLLDLALIPTTSWILRSNPWRPLLTQGASARPALVASIIPERALLTRLGEARPEACVLVTDPNAPFVAGVPGGANAMNWYDPRLSAARGRAEADPSGARWQQLLRATGVTHVEFAGEPGKGLAAALAALGFREVDREGNARLWAREGGSCDTRFRRARDEARRHFRFGPGTSQ